MSAPANTTGLPASLPFHPLLAAAHPHLTAIARHELILIIGGLILPMILIYTALRYVALPHRRSQLHTWTAFWLLLCSVVHSWLELHFVFFRDSNFARGMDLYAAADFRYGRPLEAGTAAMEWITSVILGPLCVVLLYGIVADRPWRHVVQVALCTCQMYGLTWFVLHKEYTDSPVASDDPFLFWVIFVGLNAPWGVFPPILFYKSWKAISAQFAAAGAGGGSHAMNGKANGKKLQ